MPYQSLGALLCGLTSVIKRLYFFLESCIDYFEGEPSSGSKSAEQCEKALEILTKSEKTPVCLPLFKALANFWIFAHKRKALAGKLKVDREEHEKRVRERSRDEEGRNDVGSVNLLYFWGQFHQHSTSSFYARRSQNRKKDSQVKQLFCAFGICAHRSCL